MSEAAPHVFVGEPAAGRMVAMDVTVRLSDTSPTGEWRLDAIARMLQDMATEDWENTGVVTDLAWVARRTVVRRAGQWPVLYEQLRAVTWCSGIGAAWTERRTNVYLGEQLVLEAATIWVPVNAQGVPFRIWPDFMAVYAEAINGRKVSAKVPVTAPRDESPRRPWPLRRADLDVVGHVNNAAIWQAVSEVFAPPVMEAEVVHHGPVEDGHLVEMVVEGEQMWLLVDGDVRVAARVRR